MACTVACVVGTCPEAIKMAPVILRFPRQGSGFECRVLATGQHRDWLRASLADFGISPDLVLKTM